MPLVPPMNPSNALHLEGVRFTYRRSPNPALEGIDASIPSGAFCGIIGANGAGKSTLCYTFNRIVPAFYRGEFAGTVKVMGRDTASARVADMVPTVGMVFQDFETQIFSTSLQHEIAFVMENLGLPRDRMLENAAYWMREMGLEGLEDRDPATLSGGQKQRLALASVLAAETPILVLDEPTTDLDPLSARTLIRSLETLVHRGRTVVVVTHDLDTLESADMILGMREGRIVATGSPRELYPRIETLERLGVRPPELLQLFSALGISQVPHTPQDAASSLHQLGFAVRDTPLSKPAPQGRPDFLTVEDLRFGYAPGVPLFEGLSLSFAQGEFCAVLGQNGSGKTTLMNLMAGILKPWSGTMRLNGVPILGLPAPERARQVGIVFQNPDHQIFQATCLDEVAFGLRNLGVSTQSITERAMRALETVNLTHKASLDPFTMTKGERKKLALASVLACEPHVLLLDEPTTGLDAAEQDVMMNTVSSLVDRGHTVLFITHSIGLAARFAHRIIVMAEGRVVLDGPCPDVFQDEAALAGAGLIAPEAFTLGQLLGVSVRSAGELAALVHKRA